MSMRFQSTSYGSFDSQSPSTTLVWKDINVSILEKPQNIAQRSFKQKNFKKILKNVSGEVRPGTLLAILGSSGSGKTTLLSTLSHRTPKNLIVDGKILANGKVVTSSMASQFGFVDQHDLFISTLTVKEHLIFMAKMKLDKKLKMADLERKANRVMNELGLTNAQNTRIGQPGAEKGISGGERRRLSVAVEILTDPSLLFCDEATSGLDSYNTNKLIRLLRGLAARGKTIICTIHQPSSETFSLFDGLLLLAEGKEAFLGKATDAGHFFSSVGYTCPSSYNPADFYIYTLAVKPGHEISSRERINAICNSFEETYSYKKMYENVCNQSNTECTPYQQEQIELSQHIEKPGFLVQLRWLVWRALIDAYRDPILHRAKLFQRVGVALIVGICYFGLTKPSSQAAIQNMEGGIVFCIMQNIYPCLFGTLNIFGAELPVFMREYKNGVYGCGSYYVSKMISLIPGFTLWSIVFTVSAYWLVGLQNLVYPFFMTLVAFIVVSHVSSACGLMFSALFEHLDTMMLFLVPLNQFIFLTNGFLMKMDTMPGWIYWTRCLSWFYFTNEIVSVVQWEPVKNITCDSDDGQGCLHTGEEVLEQFTFNPSNIGYDYIYLVILYIILNIVGFIGLRRRAKKV